MSICPVPPSVRVRVTTPPLSDPLLTKSFVSVPPPEPVWSPAHNRFPPESVAKTRFANGEGKTWSEERGVLPSLSASTPALGVERERFEKSVAPGDCHASSEPVKERKRPALGEGKRET